MITSFSSKAITTKAKAMYGKRLTPSDYHEMMYKQSVGEIAVYLKNQTQYGTSLKAVQESMIHRGQLENLIRRDVFYRYLRLIRYDRSTDSFYRFVITDMEITQLINCLRHLKSARSEDLIISMPGFLFPYSTINMISLAKVKSYSDLLKLLEKTPYKEVLKNCLPEDDQFIDIQLCEIILERFYFSKVDQLIRQYSSGKVKRDLTVMLSAQAELKNITAIYRLKRFFRKDSDYISKVLLPYRYLLKPKVLSGMISSKDTGEFFQFFQKSKYSLFIPERLDENLEKSIEKVRYIDSKKNIRFSTDAKTAFLAYVILSRIEVQNIVTIIEGVRYQIHPDEIEKLLIY